MPALLPDLHSPYTFLQSVFFVALESACMMASFLKILNASIRFPLLASGAGPHLVLLCHDSDVFRFQVATKLPVWKKKKVGDI